MLVCRNAVDCVEEGLSVLTRAAELRPSLPGTWRSVPILYVQEVVTHFI